MYRSMSQHGEKTENRDAQQPEFRSNATKQGVSHVLPTHPTILHAVTLEVLIIRKITNGLKEYD